MWGQPPSAVRQAKLDSLTATDLRRDSTTLTSLGFLLSENRMYILCIL
jgi:hypothetical protein